MNLAFAGAEDELEAQAKDGDSRARPARSSLGSPSVVGKSLLGLDTSCRVFILPRSQGKSSHGSSMELCTGLSRPGRGKSNDQAAKKADYRVTESIEKIQNMKETMPQEGMP
jgi:hypothetical protein